MELGISIMTKKPNVEMPGAFSFLNPLDGRVWFSTAGCLLAVAFILLLVQRNPTNAGQCTFINTLWFTVASIFRQETPNYPR